MKSRNELIAIAIMLIMCLLFAACAQKAEDKLTDKATDPSLLTSTSEKADSGKETSAKDEEFSSTESSDKVMTITDDEALKELEYFYGSLYTVERKSEGKYIVNDKNGKEYAQVTVHLSSGKVTETITQTGEKNTWNMLV